MEQAYRMIAQGRPRAAARRLLADGSAAACMLLDGLPADGPHGAVLAERLRFGPPETWRGWHRGFGAVVVKLWPPGQRLRRLRPIAHAGVAPLLDQGAGWRIFAWVAGRRLGDTPPTLPEVEQIAAAVAALHASGQAHGDLTPANVIVGDSGAVLIDWGEDCAGTPGWCPAGPRDAFARDRFALARLRSAIAGPPAGRTP